MQPTREHESGVSTLGLVIIVAGIAAVVGGYNLLRSQSVLKASDVRNASQEAGDLNYNAFSVYQALAAGPNPAIYPDPYLPIGSARMVVSSKATPNDLWKGSTDQVTIFSKSYHGTAAGKPAATDIRSTKLAAKNNARPYLLTHADVKAGTSVSMTLNKTNKDIKSTATVRLAPPPTPSCKIGFTGTPSTQPFTCIKTPAQKVEVVDPKTGLPELDPLTGLAKTIEKPATFQECPGMSRNWAFDTDVGREVTAHFFGSGVVVDASIQLATGLEGPLNFAAGGIPKNSQALPYPGAHRVESVNAGLRDIKFVANNSQWIQLNVTGPDGSVGKCVAGLHVNRGPLLNKSTDSWGADSRVQMSDGSFRRIADLKFGDRVWNPRFQESSRVLYIHETAPPQALVAVRIGTETVHVTSLHPFVSQRGLLAARDLRVGDQLPGADGTWKTVLSARVYRPSESAKVYDIFLDSPRPPMDRLLNIEGLLTPSYEWQKELGALPSLTLFDSELPLSLW